MSFKVAQYLLLFSGFIFFPFFLPKLSNGQIRITPNEYTTLVVSPIEVPNNQSILYPNNQMFSVKTMIAVPEFKKKIFFKPLIIASKKPLKPLTVYIIPKLF